MARMKRGGFGNSRKAATRGPDIAPATASPVAAFKSLGEFVSGIAVDGIASSIVAGRTPCPALVALLGPSRRPTVEEQFVSDLRWYDSHILMAEDAVLRCEAAAEDELASLRRALAMTTSDYEKDLADGYATLSVEQAQKKVAAEFASELYRLQQGV